MHAEHSSREQPAEQVGGETDDAVVVDKDEVEIQVHEASDVEIDDHGVSIEATKRMEQTRRRREEVSKLAV